MLEMIVILSPVPVTDAEVIRQLFERADILRGAEFSKYDLNQMAHWRAWDVESAAIDAATQRTQMFRAEGQGVLIFALGKHGEVPTLMLRLDADLDDVGLAAWFDIADVLEVRMSTAVWRTEHGHLPQRWAWRNAPKGVPVSALGSAYICDVESISEAQRKRLKELEM